MFEYFFSPFPFGTVILWMLGGLSTGAFISAVFWGSDADSWASHIRLAFAGAVVGAILGLGYHALRERCLLGLTSCPEILPITVG